MSVANRTSPLWAAALPAASLVLAGSRWRAQGDGTIYTSLDRTLYLRDPDLGWRAAERGVIWLGVDVLVALAALTLALAGAAALLGWRARRTGTRYRWPQRALAAVGAASLVLPALAVASGMGPQGARTSLPRTLTAAPEGGVSGAIDGLPAGTYRVVPHRETALVASLEAGGDDFEARWERGLGGFWRGDPGDLAQPMAAEILADAAAIDTGIKMRDRHARDFLGTGDHPAITFELRALEAARPEGHGIAFSARGELGLMGEFHPVAVAGTLSPVTPEARSRLELPDGDALLATAELAINLDETALAGDASAFDDHEIPIRAALVLLHEAHDSSKQHEE